MGNHGWNLRRNLNINLFDPLLRRRLNKNFADINIETASGQNVYHGLQTPFNKRFGSGIQINANYTWSHAIDDVDDQGLSDGSPRDNNNYHAETGATAPVMRVIVAPATSSISFLFRVIGDSGETRMVSWKD